MLKGMEYIGPWSHLFLTCRRFSLGLGLIFSYVLPAVAYNAQDVIVFNVSGNIVADSCNVSKPEMVDLGKYYWKDFAVAGGNTANTPVTIAFTGCTPGLTQATINFSGSPYAEDPAYASVIYANQVPADAGGTTDVGLQLFIRDKDHPVSGVALANGVTYPVAIGDDHSGSMIFTSRMYSPHGNPTPGAFSTVVTLNVTYN